MEENGRVRNDANWFVEADERLKSAVAEMFRSRSSKSSRAWQYRRAAEQVYESAANWDQHLDGLTLAYWRHSALVWITLWHLADVPDLTARDAKERLNSCFEGAPLPQTAPEEQRPEEEHRWSLSGAAGALTGAFRKNV